MLKKIAIMFASLLILSSCELKDDTIGNLPTEPGSSTKAIAVTAPNGGETLMEGGSYAIKWTGSGFSHVRIQYSADNGSTWGMVMDSVKNTGVYTWFPVPNQISNQCKIRVSSVDGVTSDISDAPFAIVKNSNESLTLKSPIGDETWQGGTAKQITWYSSGIDSVKIEYTTNNGNKWNLIAIDKKNTGIYYWEPVPNTPSTLAKIRIMDAKDGNPSTESPKTFNILPEPKLRVIAPNGGETLLSGGSRKIEWISENIPNVKIQYTTNNGSSWTTLTQSTPSIGYFDWNNIPDLNSKLCKVKVLDAVDGEPNDVSDSVFTITNQITQIIEVLTPNGGEKWQAGTAQNITWNSSGVPKIKIEYTTNNGIDWKLVVDQHANTGAYEWSVPNSLSTQCLVRISDAADGNPVDQSNAVFRIVPKPVLTLISPNGGEVWTAGKVDTIKWTSVGIENVQISFSSNNGKSWDEIVQLTESDGVYITSFTVPSNEYKIKIRNADTGSPIDESDGTFTVTDEPRITVVSPNGGESWYAGSSDNIKWTSTNIENVKIEYTTNNGASWKVIVNSTESDGVYSWSPVPNVSSLQCRIRISDAVDGIPSDISDNNFTITFPGNQLIKVTAPNGGEKWTAGSRQDITWEASGITNVKIEYTTNNGINWNIITNSTQSTGVYTWEQVPGTASTNCKVRISDAADGSPSDDSDQFFSIVPEPSIKVVTPNGNEVWQSGSNQEIKWTSENIENVKIEFTTNGGANWNVITNSTPSIGTYTWANIPNTYSLQCKVRISDAADGNPSDISDFNFQITNLVVRSLQVLTPNGGEKWEAGTKQNITWAVSNVNKIKIELSTNKGATWLNLADSVTGGAYEWSISLDLNSTQCQIRISDPYDNTLSDISDGVFTISPRKWINVTGPQTAVYKSSEPVNITWQSGGIQYVGIKYTTTNGIATAYNPAFTILAEKVAAASGSYTTYFSLPSDKYFVVVYNADEGSNNTPSNNSPGFTITKTETAEITVIAPKGGEQWLANPQNVLVTDIQNYHPYEIKWNATNLAKVKIEWSTNGGGTWHVVPGADSTENDGSFVWAPGRLETSARPDSSDNCKIRITSIGGGVPVSQISSGFFSIHQSKKLQILKPNGGEYYWLSAEERADPQPSDHWPLPIYWTSYAISGNVNIYYSLQNGASGTWQNLTMGYPSTGAYSWDFVFGANAQSQISSQLRFKIEDATDSKIFDINDGPVNLHISKTQ